MGGPNHRQPFADHMGLDATVYCDCIERGRLRNPPLPHWKVYVDPSGCRFAHTDPDDDLAFDAWNTTACEHEDGVLLHHYLGNTTRIGRIRETLSPYPDRFPLILGKVIYCGIHAGDRLSVEQVEALRAELDRLRALRPQDAAAEQRVRTFQNQLQELVAAALQLRKPISF